VIFIHSFKFISEARRETTLRLTKLLIQYRNLENKMYLRITSEGILYNRKITKRGENLLVRRQ